MSSRVKYRIGDSADSRNVGCDHRGKVDFARINPDENPGAAVFDMMSRLAFLVFEGGDRIKQIVRARKGFTTSLPFPLGTRGL